MAGSPLVVLEPVALYFLSEVHALVADGAGVLDLACIRWEGAEGGLAHQGVGRALQ